MPRAIPQIVLSKIPSVAELTSPTLPIPCSVENCGSLLTNTGTLYLHLLRHHNIDTRESNSRTVRFFCPEENCKYNENGQQNSRSFTSKKYLKQHYMKVHAKKNIPCSRCDKIFSSQAFKSAHELTCGQQFICTECKWTYKSKEALMTHCRRKNHPYARLENSKQIITTSIANKYVEIAPKSSSSAGNDSSVSASKLLCKKTQSTQTHSVDDTNDKNFLEHWNQLAAEPAPNKDSKLCKAKAKCVKSEQTSTNKTFRNLDIFDTESSTLMTISSYAQTDKNLNNLNYVEDDSLSYFGSENFHTGLCHIETQTEYQLFQGNINESTNSDHLDQMLYSNMHTQTCDEILSELGLADIETQTNWPVTDYSDLLVSTETQTIDSTFLLGNSSSTQTQTISDNY